MKGMDFFPESFGALPYFLLATSFVKLLVALSILRLGLGLEGFSFGVVMLVLSASLTLVQIESTFQQRNFSSSEGRADFERQLIPFLQEHSDPEVQALFSSLHSRMVERSEDREDLEQPKSTLSVSLASFLVSELQEALFIGLIFLIPFLLIDLFISNGLTLLGVDNLKAAVVALPAKLVFFLLIDGWALVSQRLLGSYVGG